MSSLAQPRLRSALGRPRQPRERAAGPLPVIVIGGGAAATLAAVSLSDAGLSPVLVTGGADAGRGVAYGTCDPLHRLNVPAGRMSVRADDPDGFVRWLRETHDPAAAAGDFVPRGWYGDYLGSVLSGLARCGRATVLTGRAARIQPASRSGAAGADVVLEDGTRLRTAAVALATGCPPPTSAWAPAALAADPRLVTDPWAPGKLEEIAAPGSAGRRVLLVGCGLTMVDVALSVATRNPHARITAVSRTGLLPSSHLPAPSPSIAPTQIPDGPLTLEAVRAIARASVTKAVRETGDWRPGIDGLRPVTSALWAALTVDDRARFLKEDRRQWDVLRHRMSPQISDALAGLQRTGQLEVRALGRRPFDSFDWTGYDSVVACVGQGGPLEADPLLARLLDDGLVRADAVGLGLDCTLAGNPLTATGHAWSQVSVLGALRRGQLWESTAVPELRAQAADLAHRLAAQLTTSPGPGWR